MLSRADSVSLVSPAEAKVNAARSKIKART